MKKWLPFILIALMALAIFLIKTLGNKKPPTPKPRITDPKPGAENTNRERGFDRRTGYLEYSNHAKCRMDCRKISQSEVEEIMREGKINYRKSELKNSRCPTYALEGETSDTQDVRIVFAQCNDKTVVVTVIDLETDFECHCQGDDNKYKNKN